MQENRKLMNNRTIRDKPELIVGFRQKRKNKITNKFNILLCAVEAEIPGLWVNQCSAHSTSKSFNTMTVALKELGFAERWCEECFKEFRKIEQCMK